MSAVRGRVHQGRVELETELPEGTEVVVVLADRGEAFDLDEPEVRELEERIQEADIREAGAAADLVKKLRARR